MELFVLSKPKQGTLLKYEQKRVDKPQLLRYSSQAGCEKLHSLLFGGRAAMTLPRDPPVCRRGSGCPAKILVSLRQ